MLLQDLDLSYNAIEQLPPSIGSLGQLRTLGLSHNRLRSLPNALGTLHLCWQLHLDANTVQPLPPCLAAMHAVSDFSAADNCLQQLPPWLGSWTALQTLNLAGNCISEAPPQVLAPLTALRHLQLGGNLLTRLHLPVDLPGASDTAPHRSDRQRAAELLRKAALMAPIGVEEVAIELAGWLLGTLQRLPGTSLALAVGAN